MLPGRFTLGLGTGENLNEHVLGARWPAPDERLDMLEVHQVGPDQEGFFRFWERELVPALDVGVSAKATSGA
jgi:hypothetical protein